MTTTSPPGSAQVTYLVRTKSGQPLEFLTREERDLYVAAMRAYTSQNVFTHQSDERSLERLVFLEVLIFRYNAWLAKSTAYDTAVPRWLDPKEVTDIQRQLKDLTGMVSALMNDLGLTKSQREKEQHDSVGSYITQLKQAAKEHGIRRDKQVQKAIELFMQLKSMAGSYRRSDENERKKLGIESAETIVDWILEVAAPQFDAVDAAYRVNQRAWIRKL
jgi:hypothetical protein